VEAPQGCQGPELIEMFLLFGYLMRVWRRRKPAGDADTTGGGRNAPAVQPRPSGPTGPTAAARGPLALLLHQARFDTLASMRNPRARFFTFLFPILIMVIFSSVFGHDKTTVVDGTRVTLAHFFVGGIIAMSVILSSYAGLVITITAAREAGVLKRRRATPVPPAIVIGGQALSTLVTAAFTSALLLVIARLFYGVGFAPGSLAAMAITVVIGTLAFACLGYAASAFITSADAAQPIVQATMFPLYFISGVWIPTDTLSPTLRHIAEIFPVEHLAAALHLASVRGSFTAALAPTDLIVLAGWALLTAVFAVRRFSWLPRAVTA
jgi:ABC-2 type transport system permease protein